MTRNPLMMHEMANVCRFLRDIAFSEGDGARTRNLRIDSPVL